MAEENDIALIESYLLGEMDNEARAWFEARLEEDKAFRLLFEDVQALTEGLGRVKHRALLERMDVLETRLDDPLNRSTGTKTVFWTAQRLAAVFAGLVVVALVSWFLFGTGGAKPDGASLYGEYFTMYENVMVPITRGEGKASLLDSTFQAYEQGEYTQAEVLFEALIREDDRTFIRLYAALTYMELNRQEKAEEQLEEIVKNNGDFSIQARWYLALNYLKNEEYEQSIPLLEDLVAAKSTYAPRAQELLKIIR